MSNLPRTVFHDVDVPTDYLIVRSYDADNELLVNIRMTTGEGSTRGCAVALKRDDAAHLHTLLGAWLEATKES